jgi:2C-methyl-D-erythritol 2,4-cyclodiphosphate synthase
LLAQVMSRVEGAGLLVTGADITILGARPRLGGSRLEEMAHVIAAAAGVDPGRVSVKATTANLSGDEGAGRVISASCLVSVVTR